MKKEKGFTLIELIGVISIMGLILMVVFPSLLKVLKSNTDTRFDKYYDIISESAEAYATSIKVEELGSSNLSGCVRFSLRDLIDNGFLTPLKEKQYNCYITNDLDIHKNNLGIEVRNDHGKIDTNFELICNKKGGKISSTKNVYKKGVNSNEFGKKTCDPADRTIERELLSGLLEERSSMFKSYFEGNIRYLNTYAWGNTTLKDVFGTSYLTNSENYMAHNYIYYSGQLWRAYGVDKNDGIKAVSEEPVGMAPFSLNNSSDYKTSAINNWLSEVYLPVLNKHEQYLAISNYKTNRNDYLGKIGLMSVEDYNHIRPMFSSDYYSWWVGNGGSPTLVGQKNINCNRNLTRGSSGVQKVSAKTIANIRPVITFQAETKIRGNGIGTRNNPFIIEDYNDIFTSKDLNVNNLKIGEHLYLEEENGSRYSYRVIAQDKMGTRIISDHFFPLTQFSESSAQIVNHENNDEAFLGHYTMGSYKDPRGTNIFAASLFYDKEPNLVDLQKKACKSNDRLISIGCYDKSNKLVSCKTGDVTYRRIYYKAGYYPLINCLKILGIEKPSSLKDEDRSIISTDFCQEITTSRTFCVNNKLCQTNSPTQTEVFKPFLPKPGCSNDKYIHSIEVGLPKIGEIYAATSKSNKANNVWTLNPDKADDRASFDTTINVLGKEGTSSPTVVSDKAYTRTVLTLNRNLVITGGCGTEMRPYTVSKVSGTPTSSKDCWNAAKGGDINKFKYENFNRKKNTCNVNEWN